MCRYQSIISMLSGMKTYTILMTRDPYATCAAWQAYGVDFITRNWGWVDQPPVDDWSFHHAMAKLWIQRARYLADLRDEALIWFRYEDFADQPRRLIAEIAHKIPRLQSVNPDAVIKVKAYPEQGVRNMNNEQIARLSNSQKAAIASALAENADLVERFGYAVTPPV
jgi:hypothetical protein